MTRQYKESMSKLFRGNKHVGYLEIFNGMFMWYDEEWRMCYMKNEPPPVFHSFSPGIKLNDGVWGFDGDRAERTWVWGSNYSCGMATSTEKGYIKLTKKGLWKFVRDDNAGPTDFDVDEITLEIEWKGEKKT